MSVIALRVGQLASSRRTCSRFPPLPALLLPLLALLLAALPRSLCAAGRVNRLKYATATRLVLLRNNAYGAKSPPRTTSARAPGAGRRKWHVHFPRGGWCFTPAECRERASSPFGSSHFWARRLPAVVENGGGINSAKVAYPQLGGLLSRSKLFNPVFHGWNLVWVVYYLRRRRGMGAASHVLFSSSSGGGHAIIMHCDRLAAVFPRAQATCLADSGFFVGQ
ncbi:unnamed protein product [Closterium sp. NIES-64]|nr:unnamed protein product [Closterium sp. NIES-64]